MRVILTANVIVDGGARRAGYVVSSWDTEFCEQLVERGLAVHEKPAEPPVVTNGAVAAAPETVAVVIDPPVVTEQAQPQAEREAAHPDHPHETKAQRKAREKAEREAAKPPAEG